MALRERILVLVLFLGAFGFYARNAAPSVTAGDAGEFMTAAATLSLPHAPSFPAYTFLSRAFLEATPWGSVPLRMNYFSALTSALCLVVLYLLVRRTGPPAWAAAFLVLTVGLSASFVANSLVTEVFSLNILLTALLLLYLNEPIFFAFVLGFGVGNHQILVLLLPAFAWTLWKKRKAITGKNLGILMLFGLIGFSINGALMIRTRQNPPLNWGRPDTPSRLVRTLLRKDYGALTLALGEKPARTAGHTLQQLKRFGRQLYLEIPWFAVWMGLLGLVLGCRWKDEWAPPLLLAFLFTGPLFFLLGNLPFNDQSEGIMGRFFIMPVVALLLGWISIVKRFPKTGAAAALVAVFLMAPARWVEANAHRHSFLVLDYGRAMLRTLPSGAFLLLDGGDDAFYSLALLRHGLNQRTDVGITDRGGLIFKNIYGDDFRRLTKEEKAERRRLVESSLWGQRPLFYGTMDANVLPGVQVTPVGFLKEAQPAQGPRISWPLIVLRSLYPLEPADYRHRALAAFFPYARGQMTLQQGEVNKALRDFRQAERFGTGVDWFTTNMSYEYSHHGYNLLLQNRLADAERLYRQWIQWDSNAAPAYSNLGVIYERTGRLEQAVAAYRQAALKGPELVDPVFNLAALAWARKDWPEAVRWFEEVLRRNPNHTQARNFLERARAHLGLPS